MTNNQPLSGDELAAWFHSALSHDELGVWVSRAKECTGHLQHSLESLLCCLDMIRKHRPDMSDAAVDLVNRVEFGVHQDQVVEWLQQLMAARARSR